MEAKPGAVEGPQGGRLEQVADIVVVEDRGRDSRTLGGQPQGRESQREHDLGSRDDECRTPGTELRYSNCSYAVLGNLLADYHDRTWADMIHYYFTQPMALQPIDSPSSG